MSFKHVEVWIEGVMPLLQYRFNEQAQANVPGGGGKGMRKSITAIDQQTPREIAETFSYRENGPDSPLNFPGSAIMRLLREAGSNHKEKGTRKSLKYRVPASVLVTSEFIELYQEDRKTRLTTFEVDSRSAVNQVTKGRIMVHRPRLDEWSAKMQIRINEELMSEAVVRQLLTEGGQQIGIGAFRPEKGGPFGIFDVVAWDVMDARQATAIGKPKKRAA
jgi:hypothetical protein